MDLELRGCQGSAVMMSHNPRTKHFFYEMQSIFVPVDSVFLSHFEKSSHPVFIKNFRKFLVYLFLILSF